MKTFDSLGVLVKQEALACITRSDCSVAQKLLLASLVTQARAFEYEVVKGEKPLLILDVTHFLNHRINTRLMGLIGRECAAHLRNAAPDIILTAPSSGNIPAFTTALNLDPVPDVLYAPKGTPITMSEIYQAKSRSYTHGRSVTLTVAKDCLPKGARVALCDDFLDTGKTSIDLANIVSEANARIVSCFFVIEKPFGGRERLIEAGFGREQIFSLITIEAMRSDAIKIKGFDCWFGLTRKTGGPK